MPERGHAAPPYYRRIHHFRLLLHFPRRRPLFSWGSSSRPLEYVHSDLWGPAQVDTVGGRKYFLSLIDHYSRKVWIYLLRNKDEAFANFKLWKTMVESQSKYTLKCLKTDNGLEFCNNSFNEYCKQHGIKRHLTVPGTPQQNGTAERMNRTLLEKARCMLFNAGMKGSLWGEAVTTAAYLINRSPSSVIDFKTPQEKWTGKVPNLAHLRPFGCSAYAQISQGKLQPRAQKCVMLGYPEGVKGYKLLLIQPRGYKVITSRSVTFNEEEYHFKTKLMPSVEPTDTPHQEPSTGIPAGQFYNNQDLPPNEEEEFDLGQPQDQEDTEDAPEQTHSNSSSNETPQTHQLRGAVETQLLIQENGEVPEMDGCRSAGTPRRLIIAVFIIFAYYYTTLGAALSFRGVHPLDENYFASKLINCKDGSNSFTVDRVNDDFCDCVDGTDEPGTAACPRGKFYCPNAGSVPKFLYSSRVNDHICDCCDGSDEYDGVIHCPNTCIMGGNLEFKAEYHHHSTGGAIDAKGSKPAKKLEDLIHNVIGLKVLAIIQLAFLVIVFSFHFLRRRSKSRRGRFRSEGYT